MLAYQPYKGPASIPHVSGDFFGAFFLGVNVSGSSLNDITIARRKLAHTRCLPASDHPALPCYLGQCPSAESLLPSSSFVVLVVTDAPCSRRLPSYGTCSLAKFSEPSCAHGNTSKSGIVLLCALRAAAAGSCSVVPCRSVCLKLHGYVCRPCRFREMMPAASSLQAFFLAMTCWVYMVIVEVGQVKRQLLFVIFASL